MHDDIIEVLEMFPEYAADFWNNLCLTFDLHETGDRSEIPESRKSKSSESSTSWPNLNPRVELQTSKYDNKPETNSDSLVQWESSESGIEDRLSSVELKLDNLQKTVNMELSEIKKMLSNLNSM